MKIWKYFFVLSAFLGFLLTGASVSAEVQKQEVEIGKGKYLLDEQTKTAVVSGYDAMAEEAVIPAEIVYRSVVYKVTKIGKNAFSRNYIPYMDEHDKLIKNDEVVLLRRVVLPEGIVEIEEEAFAPYFYDDSDWAVSHLDSVVLPSTLKKIGKYAFAETRVKKVTLPEGLEELGEGAFYAAGMKQITIPGKIKVIPKKAFYGCFALKKIVFGKGINELEMDSFAKCIDLKKVKLPEGVQKIAAYAFWRCSRLETVSLPASLKELGTIRKEDAEEIYRYRDGYLEEKRQKAVERWAFQGCKSLKKIKVNRKNKKYKSVDTQLYSKNGKTLYFVWKTGKTFQVPDTVKVLASRCFLENKTLRKVKLPDGLRRIESYAFYFARLRSVTIPKSVRKIGHNSLYLASRKAKVIFQGSRPPKVACKHDFKYVLRFELGDAVYAPKKYVQRYRRAFKKLAEKPKYVKVYGY